MLLILIIVILSLLAILLGSLTIRSGMKLQREAEEALARTRIRIERTAGGNTISGEMKTSEKEEEDLVELDKWMNADITGC